MEAVTTSEVAKAAGCAKGLIHYHFSTKSGLLAEVARNIGASRAEAWQAAFATDDPQKAIDQTWELLRSEAKLGVLRAWLSLGTSGDRDIGRAVSRESMEFRDRIVEWTKAMLSNAGLTPTIGDNQLGRLVMVLLQGTAMELATGGRPSELEEAYAAGWLGVLGLAI
ncbi:MAG: TetR/AcrR family transcriptional regulator, partial [Gemmatimonadota bacterium]|nr:TetR/AcrR family transcriptional regulator [Gemmatimonadota bacterium]